MGSDLARVDAHTPEPEEYEELPELSAEELERGKWYVAGEEVTPETGKTAFREALRRGRPKSEKTKTVTTIRLDADVVDAFKAKGKGWQGRINQALRQWLEEHSAA